MGVHIQRRQSTPVWDGKQGSCPKGHDKEYSGKGNSLTLVPKTVDITTDPYCWKCGSKRKLSRPSLKKWREITIICDGCKRLISRWEHEGWHHPPLEKNLLKGFCNQCGTRYGSKANTSLVGATIVTIIVVAGVIAGLRAFL